MQALNQGHTPTAFAEDLNSYTADNFALRSPVSRETQDRMAFTCLEAIGAWLDLSRRSPALEPRRAGLKVRLLLRRLGS